jgi:putative membrane protein
MVEMSESVNAVAGGAYLYVKAFHILFVASWFAGLFYLPRIFVNMAQETNPQALERLLGMSHRLYRFMTILMIPALVLGLILWLYYGVGKGPGSGWMHAKLFLVFILLGYHHACGSIHKKFKAGINQRSHVWYRWFNELPVVIFLIVSILVVVKPF